MAESSTGNPNPNLPSEYVTLKQLQQLRLQEKQQLEESSKLEKFKDQQKELQEKRPPKGSKPLRRRSKPKNPNPPPDKSSPAVQSPDPKSVPGSDNNQGRRGRRGRGEGQPRGRTDEGVLEIGKSTRSTSGIRRRRGSQLVKFEDVGRSGMMWVPKSTCS
ncbi:hypothetical protein IHE45_13G033700 [Dioscorea alata]|uniref:Uncharacterized protein n=1 Tax=Dioscorea alata TaxID=55571 RepID=A0ACB7UX28_DIOAL|nr:hypothetical protein IHE45_13G033700 [Dioscorea alata]